MKNIYENKRIWKFYFILIILLMPLVIATVKWVGFNIIDTVVFVLFHYMDIYVIMALLIREVELQKIDQKDIININEMKIRRVASYLAVGFFIFSYIMDSISILNGEQETLSLVMFLIMCGLLWDAGIIITKNKIYYRNKIIERKEIVRVEEKNANNIRIYLANGKDVRIRYKKVVSYIEPFESKVK